jgi:hypothetical protein
LESARLQPGTKIFMRKLAELSWENLGRLKPSAAQQDEIREFLHGFLIYQFGRLPKARA